MTNISVDTEQARVVASLAETARATSASSYHSPKELPLNRIIQRPEVFQPRDLRLLRPHVDDLARIIRRLGRVDPILVIPFGHDYLLVDGHHRLAAYQLVEKTKAIPVEVFQGDLEDAILEAGRANSKAKLPMTKSERMNHAWRLVKMGVFSKAQICEASSVSDGQVGRMRRTLGVLGTDADNYDDWGKALRGSKEIDREPLSQEDMEDFLEYEAQQLANRMSRTFGSKLSRNPEITARALMIHLGRKLPETVNELKGMLSEADWYFDEDEDDDF